MKKYLIITLVFSILFTTLGAMFKVQHLSFATSILSIGLISWLSFISLLLIYAIKLIKN